MRVLFVASVQFPFSVQRGSWSPLARIGMSRPAASRGQESIFPLLSLIRTLSVMGVVSTHGPN